MNASQFMDKQIMDLTSSPSKDKDKEQNLMDLMNHPSLHEDEDNDPNDMNNNRIRIGIGIGVKKEEIVPSYDFQPIRGGLSQSLSLDSSANTAATVWNSLDNKNNSSSSPIRNYRSQDNNPPNFILGGSDAAVESDIDQIMKKYSDNLLHVLEGVSARLTQLETRTCNIENSIDDLKVSIGNNCGSADGKMRKMEIILGEVQSGIHFLKDKQEILEAHMKLGKLQVSNIDQPSENQNTVHTDAVHQAASAPQQSQIQHPPAHVTFSQSVSPPVLQQNLPPPPQQNLPHLLQQNLPPTVQLPRQFPQSLIPTVSQQDSYLPTPGQTQDIPSQPYPVPLTQQQSQAPPSGPPHQPYQPAPQPPPYSVPPQPQYSVPPQPQYAQPPQLPLSQSSLGHHPEGAAYVLPQNYPSNLHQPPSQTYYGAPISHIFESTSNRPNSGVPTGYGTHSGPNEPHSYGGAPSQYGSGLTMKPQQHSSTMVHSGGSSYPQLPTAQVLPQAIATASGVGGESGSPGTGNKVPIDDVVDKVTSMGFPRDHVRAAVRKMTENGQSVDLNMVLDKLMNDGEVQPPRGWFGR